MGSDGRHVCYTFWKNGQRKGSHYGSECMSSNETKTPKEMKDPLATV